MCEFGSLAVWQFGSLAVWQFGSLAVRAAEAGNRERAGLTSQLFESSSELELTLR